MLLALFTLAAAFVPSSLAKCEDKCGSVSKLLSKCSLPPLNADWTKYKESHKIEREGGNLYNYIILSDEKTRCFCSTARDTMQDCLDCYDDTDQGLKAGEGYMAESYRSDCKEMGYFLNDDLTYPSTTRQSEPSSTAKPADATKCLGDDSCGPLQRQIEECGLSSFKTYPNDTREASSEGDLLWNRTAAECLCTMPVLRRLHACTTCLSLSLPRGAGIDTPFTVASTYRDECHYFGYWSDDKVVEYSETSTQTQAAPSATADSKDGAGILWDRNVVIVLLSGLILSISMSL